MVIDVDTELDLSSVPDPRKPLWLRQAPHVSQWWSSDDEQTRRLCQLDSGHLLNIYAEMQLSRAEEEDPEYFVKPIIELIERTLKCRRYLTQRERRPHKVSKPGMRHRLCEGRTHVVCPECGGLLSTCFAFHRMAQLWARERFDAPPRFVVRPLGYYDCPRRRR